MCYVSPDIIDESTFVDPMAEAKHATVYRRPTQSPTADNMEDWEKNLAKLNIYNSCLGYTSYLPNFSSYYPPPLQQAQPAMPTAQPASFANKIGDSHFTNLTAMQEICRTINQVNHNVAIVYNRTSADGQLIEVPFADGTTPTTVGLPLLSSAKVVDQIGFEHVCEYMERYNLPAQNDMKRARQMLKLSIGHIPRGGEGEEEWVAVHSYPFA